jgi:hypothetical protein
MLFSNEDSSNIKFDLIFASVVIIVEVIGCSVGDVEDSSEDDLSLGIEVNPVQGRIRLSTNTFVEVNVVVIIDVILLS